MRYFILTFILFLSSCLSFKGITIPQGVKTFYVEPPVISERNAPPEIGQIFMETLRLKIRQQSNLIFDDSDPHVIFSPVISRYSVNAVAPQDGDIVAFNRLDVSVTIDYENTLNEEDNFSKSFSAFQDFNATESLQALEEGLIEIIFDDITERAFNETFSDW